jgi:hypothetical protein
MLEREIEEMCKRNVSIAPIVCEFDATARLTSAKKRSATHLEFLPDAAVIEAEWQANPALAQKLEETRAGQSVRPAAAIFLRQARFALMLRNWLREKNISHVHATSSRALLCATLLRELVDLKISATIEPRPELAPEWIERALKQCVGGRLHDRRLLQTGHGQFLADKSSGFHLTGHAKFWQEWAQLLQRWGSENRK